MSGWLILDQAVQILGSLAVLAALIIVGIGITQGIRRPAGRSSGKGIGLLRQPTAIILWAVLGTLLSFWLWQPIGWRIPPLFRPLTLLSGALLYFAGLGLVIWGHLTLGKYYFVSSGFGAQLFADHRLIQHGPYALVRHPMYLGILLTGLGGMLLYQTWTLVLITGLFPGLVLRSRREEAALAAEFGKEWQAYSKIVPPFFPRLFSSQKARQEN